MARFLSMFNWKKTVIAAQSGDAMTNFAYTGKGFFTQLGEKTDALLKAENIEFVYGFPNQNSYPGYIKKLH